MVVLPLINSPLIHMFRILPLFIFLVVSLTIQSQVGVGNVMPQAALDIASPTNGILIPRVALASATDVATVTSPNAPALVVSTLVFNLGTNPAFPNAGYYYWTGSRWDKMVTESQSNFYMGTMVITAAGVQTVTGVGFRPSTVEFIAVNRAKSVNALAGRSSTNNSNDIRMAGGYTTGYARNNAGAINQQVISFGFSGSSLNNIGTYASSSHCLAAYFVDNNGTAIRDNGTAAGGTNTQDGLIRASFTNFDADGFRINVDRFLNPATPAENTNAIVVIYKAYR